MQAVLATSRVIFILITTPLEDTSTKVSSITRSKFRESASVGAKLPVCISRVDTTQKFLSLCEALGRPRPLTFAHVICATNAHSPSARSTGFLCHFGLY